MSEGLFQEIHRTSLAGYQEERQDNQGNGGNYIWFMWFAASNCCVDDNHTSILQIFTTSNGHWVTTWRRVKSLKDDDTFRWC